MENKTIKSKTMFILRSYVNVFYHVPGWIFSNLLFCFCSWVEVAMFVIMFLYFAHLLCLCSNSYSCFCADLLMCPIIFCILFCIKFFLFREYGFVFYTALFFACYVNVFIIVLLLGGSFTLISCSYSWVDL